jgi:hypothetical protein
LVPDSLSAGLPLSRGFSVLTSRERDECPNLPDDPRWPAVLSAARRDFAVTILDAGRGDLPEALGSDTCVVLVVPGLLRGLVGARRVLPALRSRRIVVAVRPSKWLSTEEVAEELEIPTAVTIPMIRGMAERIDCGDVLDGSSGRSLQRLGSSIWAELAR